LQTQAFHIPKEQQAGFKHRLYHYADGFDTCFLLDNNQNTLNTGTYELVAGIGAKAVLRVDEPGNAFEQLKSFHASHGSWLLGYLEYDLKNEVEHLVSGNFDGLGFPVVYFFVPEVLVLVKGEEVTIDAADPQQVFNAVRLAEISNTYKKPHINFTPRISKEDYIQKVEQVRRHIEEGDVYELNLCMEFYAEQAEINPLQTYLDLIKLSPVPFAAYGKLENQYHVMCASPERFMKKTGDRLISQPIKGTAKRGKTAEEDETLKQSLLHSEKERAENVMIVDLVRNDLARSAVTGSVKVDELFGIYTFPQVHQMVSTISGTIRQNLHWADAIALAFPMGSMTGAPKVKAMELIEHYEETRRGLFSGAIGYITPGGDFDFNVVIRSLLYTSQNQYLSYQVGGAITYDSNPEQEYQECLLKAKAIRQVWE